jgi:hypothetical protein
MQSQINTCRIVAIIRHQNNNVRHFANLGVIWSQVKYEPKGMRGLEIEVSRRALVQQRLY